MRNKIAITLLTLICALAIGISSINSTGIASEMAFGQNKEVVNQMSRKVKNAAKDYKSMNYGSYWQEDTNGDGKADESDAKTPIQWRILWSNASQAMLMAEQCLDARAFHGTDENVTWESCDVRKWLNDSFLQNAFSAKEQEAILMKEIVTENEVFTEWGGVTGDTSRITTTDKIFLPSAADMCDISFGFNNQYSVEDSARQATNTAYCASKAERYAAGVSDTYWLRNSGQSSNQAQAVYVNGIISYQNKVTYTGHGIRPVLYLDLAKAEAAETDAPSTPKPVVPTSAPDAKKEIYIWQGEITGWGGPDSYPSSANHEQGSGEDNFYWEDLTNIGFSNGYGCGLELMNPYSPYLWGTDNEMAQFIKKMQNPRIKVTLKNGGVASSWNWDTELSFPSGKEVALPDGYLDNGYFALFGNDDVITKVEIYDVGQGGNQPTTSLKPPQTAKPTASSGVFQTATPSLRPVPSQTDRPSATREPKVSPVKRQLVKTPGKVKIKKLKNSGKGRIKVTWKKVNCNEGYQVQYSRKRNFSKKTTRYAQGSSIYIYGKAKKVYYVYYVRVRAVNWGWKTQSKQGYKYGKWSNVKKIRIKLGSLSYFLHNSYC